MNSWDAVFDGLSELFFYQTNKESASSVKFASEK